MSYTYTGVSEADRAGKGSVGRPDTPNLTTGQMQEVLDELSNLAIDKLNELVAELNAHAGNAVESEQITNIRFNNNEFQFSTDNGASWNNTGSVIEVSVSPNDIHMEGYSKAEVAAAILITDSLNQAMGKLEKKADDNAQTIQNKTVIHDFTITTTWTANDNTRNNTKYPYKQFIETEYFDNTSADATLDGFIISATEGEVMTEAEEEDSYKICKDCTKAEGGFYVYASEETTVALRLRVKGV